ncbi:hypothetical protein MHBO_004835, partial [Bonamia ostreae]
PVNAGLYEAAKEVVNLFVYDANSIGDKPRAIELLSDALANSKPAETFEDFWDRVIDKTDGDTRISNVTMNYMYKHCMDAWDKPKECGEWCEHWQEWKDLEGSGASETLFVDVQYCFVAEEFNPTYGMPGCPHGGSDA